MVLLINFYASVAGSDDLLSSAAGAASLASWVTASAVASLWTVGADSSTLSFDSSLASTSLVGLGLFFSVDSDSAAGVELREMLICWASSNLPLKRFASEIVIRMQGWSFKNE